MDIPMHHLFKNRKNQRFGRLLVVDYAGKHGAYHKWECLCDCGNRITTFTNCLVGGNTQSCGCLCREINKKHGMYNSPEYSAHKSMKERCYNKNNKMFDYYGGRGIKVCDTTPTKKYKPRNK